ncbi:MAG: phosphate-binding protein, partial [Chloroflexota bacterium]
MKSSRFVLLLCLLVLTACGSSSGQTNSQLQTSAYIENKGSDTIVNLALAWAERYQVEHPEV